MATTDAAAALHGRLEESLRTLVTSDDWLAAIRVASQFHDYSFANTLLILGEAERRGITTTKVAGYRKWQELGRQVRRGEKGIPILAPLVRNITDPEPDQPRTPNTDTTKEERRVVGFRVVHVFDLSQTDGPPLPEVAPKHMTGDLPEQWDRLTQLIANAGFTLSFDDPARLDGANGSTHWINREVTLRDDLSGAQRFKTAAHELAHIRLHDPHGGERPDCRGVIEVEAESVAYIVSAAAGVDSATYTLPYVATWARGDASAVTRTAQRVIDCARTILPALEHHRHLEPAIPERGQSVGIGVDREQLDPQPGLGRSQPAVDDGSVFSVDTPSHGPVLTQDGGCASCGADPTRLVIYDAPRRGRGGGGEAYNELACEQHAQRARRGGAMVYPATVIPQVVLARGRRQARQRIADTEAVLDAAITHYQGWLRGPQGQPARRYLDERGITADTAEQFQLGYAPPRWRTLADGLKRDGHSPDQLLAAGVVARARTGALYDTMRGRLVFPIHDHTGRPRGFAGRIIEGDGPKYINTPATTLYRKSELLYGHHHTHAGIVEHGGALVVEGYLDVLACHQTGLTNTVAPGGTAITADHLDALRRTTHHITLALDGDKAGALAARRVLDTANQVDPNLHIRVATLPQGQDPADLLHQDDRATLQKALDDAVPLAIHAINQAIDRPGLDNTETAWEAIRDTTAIVFGITDPDLRTIATEHIAQRLGWATDSIQRGLDYHRSETRTRPTHPAREQLAPGRSL